MRFFSNFDLQHKYIFALKKMVSVKIIVSQFFTKILNILMKSLHLRHVPFDLEYWHDFYRILQKIPA